MTLLKAILHMIGMVLIPMAIAYVFLYTLGSFIAWDTNPSHWWLFTSITGRCLFIMYTIGALANVPTFWEQFGD
jgi:hypothetical protein